MQKFENTEAANRLLITDGSHPAAIEICNRLTGWKIFLNLPADANHTNTPLPPNVEPISFAHWTDKGVHELLTYLEKSGGVQSVIISDRDIYHSSIENADDEAYVNSFRRNVMSAFFVAKEIVMQMANNGGGALLNLSTVFAQKPTGAASSYSVAQSAVNMLFKELALFYGRRGVRVNTLRLGPFEEETPLFDSLIQPANYDAETKIALGRRITGSDVAAAVEFLLNNRDGFINGADLTIDGGQLLHYFDRDW